MLYPKEDAESNTLTFACRTCAYWEVPQTSCIYRNDLSNTVGETAGITQDVGQDPTVRVPHRVSIPQEFSPTQSISSLNSSMQFSQPALGQRAGIGGAAAPRVHPVEEENMHPVTCTVCGQEIVCETCGRPTAMGCWLEVEDDDEPETYVADLVRTFSNMSGLERHNTGISRTASGLSSSFVIGEDFEHEYMSDPMSEDDETEYYSEHPDYVTVEKPGEEAQARANGSAAQS
jgi:DNA-directed RNA polymerase subunit M/transcription elongation factor TFIIS